LVFSVLNIKNLALDILDTNAQNIILFKKSTNTLNF